jgi:hypothetical protein
MAVNERKAKIADLRDRFEVYDALDRPDRATAQERGREFETMVRDVFRAWGLLRRDDYHTKDNKSEQIDGVVELAGRFALLEVKWEKERIAASELFAFLGKVEGKFLGTIGVFVSRNTLSDNFLNALRAGRRQCIIVLHGDDVDAMFDPDFDLKGYLATHLFHVCVDNLCHLKSEDYLKAARRARAQAEAEEDAPVAQDDPVAEKIMECLKNEDAVNLVHEFADSLEGGERVTAIRRVLDGYADLISDDGRDGSWRGNNLNLFLQELVKRLPNKLTAADTEFFMKKLSPNFRNRHYREMTTFFAPRYSLLSADDKEKFEQRLCLQWDKVIDNWSDENEMAVATRALWDQFTPKTWTHLYVHYISFLGSSRQTHRDQYAMARAALGKPAGKNALRAAVRRAARKSAKSWFESDDDYKAAGGTEIVKKRVVNTLAKVKPFLPNYEIVVRNAVAKYAKDEGIAP